MNKEIVIAGRFCLPSPAVSCAPLGAGHIHDTSLITCGDGTRFTLQQINRAVFPDIPLLMDNVRRVSAHLAGKAAGEGTSLRLVETLDGRPYATDEEGGVWRMFAYVPGVCRERAALPEAFALTGCAFGRFLRDLSDLPAASFPEVIPDFHHTPKRFDALRQAVSRDVRGRARLIRAELAAAFSREEQASSLIRRRDAGVLPVRLIHGDTKCSNVVLDEQTGRPVCVLDLDTVMPGLAAWDAGEACRTGANTAAEDETDLTRVRFRLPYYEAFCAAYQEAADGLLTPEEARSLPAGVITMTCENAVRFLTDYLNGDVYFKTACPDHNLVRARCQLRLLEEEEEALSY